MASDGTEDLIRLNRFLSLSGVCSRRAADELIKEGRVSIDGKTVGEPGVKVDPQRHEVRVDGKAVRPESSLYVAFHKPAGVVCTNAAGERRKRVIDCLPELGGRVYTVGRLDADSTGLILVTNDGGFAQAVAHPRHGVKKTYEAVVKGAVTDAALDRLRAGVRLDDVVANVERVQVRRCTEHRTELVITLSEGRNREIRRMLAKVGCPVLALKRVRIGALDLGDLRPGGHRHLRAREVQALLQQATP